jgi:hypothetical protein
MSPVKVVSLFFLILFLITCSAPKKQVFSIHQRAEWGAIDSVVPKNHDITKITIHHGGETFAPDKDMVTYLKNLQSWSRREKKWMDVPYHYLISPKGEIYVGRPDSIAGDTNTTYNPSGHLLICALGNFEEVEVPKAQYDALIWLTKKMMVDHYVSIDSIATHKDFAETQCPGTNLYKFFENGQFKRDLN